MCTSVNPRRAGPGAEGQDDTPQGPRPGSVLAVTSIFEEQQVALLACPAPRFYPPTLPPQDVREDRLLLPEASELSGTPEDGLCSLPTLYMETVLMVSLIASFLSLAYLPRQSAQYFSE